MKNPLHETDFGFLKTLFIVMLGTIFLQSCDMGKYYFRMHPGGKDRQPQNVVQEETASNSFSILEEKAPVRMDQDSVFETAQPDSPIPMNSVENSVPKITIVQEKTEIAQPELRNEANEEASHTKIKSKHRKASFYLSSEQQFILTIYGLVMLFMLCVSIIVFFVSWIFAPALLALKIALWTLAGLSLFPTILMIVLYFTW